MTDYIDFRKELRSLINRRSIENGSNTQDFILANYLTACLMAFENAVTERDKLQQAQLNVVIPSKEGSK